jgi:hypothetical protein
MGVAKLSFDLGMAAVGGFQKKSAGQAEPNAILTHRMYRSRISVGNLWRHSVRNHSGVQWFL